MASPSPVTMPAFEVVEGQVYVVKKSTKVLGQMSSITLNSQTSTKKLARLGDTGKSTSYSPAEYTANLEMYSEFDPDQLGVMLGVTKPVSGGWVGTEVLRLNATTAAYDLTVEVYGSATGTSDVIKGIWTLTNFKISSMNVPITADNASTITLQGDCDDIKYIPSAGVGA